MKHIQYITLALSFVLLTFSACKKDEVPTHGTFSLEFDNKVGTDDIVLESMNSTNYPYSNQASQQFNITKFGYYISRVELSGPNGEKYVDEVKTGATADEVKGFYQVIESNAASQTIKLENVPTGSYNKVTFTLGVEADYVEQGATGGVLDPANGGWLWNWDSGYILWKFEGHSPFSTSADNSIKYHIGGWKEIAGNAGMTNNVKRITLDFPSVAEVTETSNQEAHIIMDLLKVVNGHHPIDFSTTSKVMSPAAGKDIAHSLEDAFKVHGIH